MDPGADPDLDRLVHYRSFADSRVYLGGSLQNSGRLYNVENELLPKNGGRVKRLEGASYTADLVDSSVLHGRDESRPQSRVPDERGPVGRRQRVELLQHCDPAVGLDAPTTDLPRPGDTAEQRDFYVKVFQIIDMQTHRNLCTGNHPSCLPARHARHIHRQRESVSHLAQPEAGAGCTLREGDDLVTSWKLKISGRELWYNYVVYSESGYGECSSDSSSDANVPTTRQLAIVATLTDIGGLNATSRYKRNQQIVKALTFSLPVSGWYTPKGVLWQPNQARDRGKRNAGDPAGLHVSHPIGGLRLHEGRLYRGPPPHPAGRLLAGPNRLRTSGYGRNDMVRIGTVKQTTIWPPLNASGSAGVRMILVRFGPTDTSKPGFLKWVQFIPQAGEDVIPPVGSIIAMVESHELLMGTATFDNVAPDPHMNIGEKEAVFKRRQRHQACPPQDEAERQAPDIEHIL